MAEPADERAEALQLQDQFSYSPLAEGRIRLISVERAAPDKGEPVLRCKIDEVSLDPPPKFFALSYAWGSEEATEHILLDGRPFAVRPNLYDALDQLSRKSELTGCWLWIDAICINQHDHEEKSVQVKRMPDVYTCAHLVLIWLGAAADNSDLVMDNIRNMIQMLNSIELGEKSVRSLPAKDHHIWTAFVKLYARPWFRRLWIMQEAVLAKGSYVLCGDRTLPTSALEDFAEKIPNIYAAVLYQHGQDPYDPTVNGFVSISQIKTLRRNLPSDSLTFFSSLLSIAREREVSVALDRIYGLSALMPKKVHNELTVNYDWQTWEGYLGFARWFIQHEPGLNLLSMAPSVERTDELPSWCPNFDSPSTEGHLYSLSVAYKAGFSNRSERRCTVRLSEDDENAIIIPGFRLDVVGKVVESPRGIAASPDQAENYGSNGTAAKDLKWESECLDLFQETYAPQKVIPDGLDIHARTLCANHFHLAEPVPAAWPIVTNYLSLKTFWKHLATHETPGEKHAVGTSEEQKSQLKYSIALELQNKRKYFNTVNRRVGMGPSQVRPGDVICVFESGAPLFVLRFEDDGKKARLVGDAYMHGCMDWDTMPVDSKENWEEFVVI